MGFSRQEYWSGLPFPSPGDLPDPRIELESPALAGGFFTTAPLGKPSGTKVTLRDPQPPWARRRWQGRVCVGFCTCPHVGLWGLQERWWEEDGRAHSFLPQTVETSLVFKMVFCARGAFDCWATVLTISEVGVNLPAVLQRGKRRPGMEPQKDSLAGLHPDHILSCLESLRSLPVLPFHPPSYTKYQPGSEYNEQNWYYLQPLGTWQPEEREMAQLITQHSTPWIGLEGETQRELAEPKQEWLVWDALLHAGAL